MEAYRIVIEDAQMDRTEQLACDCDCFACCHGECIALEQVMLPCSFMKTHEENYKAIRRSFYRLISAERFDLLMKYRKILFRFGIFDRELCIAHNQQRSIELYGLKHQYLLGKGIDWDEDISETIVDDKQGELIERAEPDAVFDNDLNTAVFPDGKAEEEIVAENRKEMEEYAFTDEIYEESVSWQTDEISNAQKEILDIAEDDVTVDPEEGCAESITDEIEDAVQKITSIIMNGMITIRWRPLIPNMMILKGKRLPDPVDDAYVLLAGGIIYRAVEDYIETTMRLWEKDIVAALIHGRDSTLKRYCEVDGEVFLWAENGEWSIERRYIPFSIDDSIQGVAVSIVKKIQRERLDAETVERVRKYNSGSGYR